MRSKTILSIAAFIIAFVLSTAFASLFITKSEPFSSVVVTPGYYGKKTSCFKNRGNFVAGKIETIIKQDVSNGGERDRKLYRISEGYRPSYSSPSFPEYVEAVSEYVDSSESLSHENTPRDFQTAWLKHMKAWRDYSNFLDKMKSSSARAHFSPGEIHELEAGYSADINSTWYEVLSIGNSYGADVY
ncbi:MAG TPA: hypothetical protein VF556_15575 [Pyrinomonadaceae bacterium]|jgi:hypothetical protein